MVPAGPTLMLCKAHGVSAYVNLPSLYNEIFPLTISVWTRVARSHETIRVAVMFVPWLYSRINGATRIGRLLLGRHSSALHFSTLETAETPTGFGSVKFPKRRACHGLVSRPTRRFPQRRRPFRWYHNRHTDPRNHDTGGLQIYAATLGSNHYAGHWH
jgi:hypothetical protein